MPDVLHRDALQHGAVGGGDLDLPLLHRAAFQILDRQVAGAGPSFFARRGQIGQLAAFVIGNQPVAVADVEVIAQGTDFRTG